MLRSSYWVPAALIRPAPSLMRVLRSWARSKTLGLVVCPRVPQTGGLKARGVSTAQATLI